MYQQINFYKLLPKQRLLRGSLEQLLFFYMAFMLVLLMSSLFVYWHKHQKVLELEALLSELSIKKTELADLVKQYPMLNPQDLNSSMQKLQKELDTKAKMVSLLSNTYHFSEDLKALAVSSVPSVWLTEIIISNSGRDIQLKGLTSQSAAIQQFLDRLAKQPVFLNRPMELRELTQAAAENAVQNDKKSYLSFYIATKTVK